MYNEIGRYVSDNIMSALAGSARTTVRTEAHKVPFISCGETLADVVRKGHGKDLTYTATQWLDQQGYTPVRDVAFLVTIERHNHSQHQSNAVSERQGRI